MNYPCCFQADVYVLYNIIFLVCESTHIEIIIFLFYYFYINKKNGNKTQYLTILLSNETTNDKIKTLIQN